VTVSPERAGLRTGEVADQAGVNIQTLRYYERRGLLANRPHATAGTGSTRRHRRAAAT
jgi:DNA-binding transcriptional MerR regulator